MAWKAVALVGAALAGLAVLGLPALMAGVIGAGDTASAQSCPAQTVSKVTTTAGQLTAAQLAIAGTIISTAEGDSRLGQPGAVIGLMVGLQESDLTNDGPMAGNDGSLGVFQQRHAAGWGSTANELDVAQAADMFYGLAPTLTKDKGLLQVRGWQQMPPGAAGQAVQNSAFPSAYDKWQPLAQQLVANAKPTGATLTVDNCAATGPVALPGTASTLPTQVLQAIAEAPTANQTAIAFALAQIGCKYTWGGTGPCSSGFDCSGLVQKAWAAAGVAIDRTSEIQWAKLPKITAAELVPGDLVFYEGQPPAHVVMYLGAGWIVEAPHTGAVVHVLPMYSGETGYATTGTTAA